MKMDLNGCAVLSDFHGFGSRVELLPVVNAPFHFDAGNEEISGCFKK